MTTTPGKLNGLTRAANSSGVFTIFAIDHRDAMRAVLDPGDPDGVSDGVLTAMKLEFAGAMGSEASAVLLDPEYSAFEAVRTNVLPRDTSFLVALEGQGYVGDPSCRVTGILDGWSVEKAKLMGAAGVKLLLLYRPDSAAAEVQEELVATVVRECERWDIPLFLEPVGYPLGARYGQEPSRRWIVCESVRRLGALGPDILKVQFPADTTTVDRPEWEDACAELDEASPVPWALLSGGDPFRSFLSQVEIACAAGSSGFLVGRALWGEPARMETDDRTAAIHKDVIPRFRELASVASALGTSWTSRAGGNPPSVGFASYGVASEGPANTGS